MTKFRWSKKHLTWLRKSYELMTPAEMAPAFLKNFGQSVTANQIRAALRNHKITQSKRTGRFEKGSKPWNLGVKGFMGSNVTSFQKGHLPHNHKPLWSERISKNGYIEMSVPEKNPYTGFETRYKLKHIWLWEQRHGAKPKGTAIIFIDGNNRNLEDENFMLVTRAELLALNRHRYKDVSPELKPTVLALALVEAAAHVTTRPTRGR